MDIKKRWSQIKAQPVAVMVINIAAMAVVYMLCRLFFFAVNHSYFTDVTFTHFINLCRGGIQFDRTALLYTSIIYIAMMVLPLRQRNSPGYQKAARWIFVVCNAIAIVMNMADTGFFQYTNRRTTFSIFGEFSHESNLASVLANGMLDFWYIVVAAVLLIWGIWKIFVRAEGESRPASARAYYPLQAGLMALAVWLTVVGIRGGFTRDTRPITLSNANEFVNKSTEAAIVLNTPFCMYRTVNKKIYKNPHYYATQSRLDSVFTPVVMHPRTRGEFKPLNVVVLIIESFGKEYSGFFNPGLEGGTYKGYTPFLDSLYRHSLVFSRSYATGRKSIDAMPSVLSSIPMYEEPFILTPYSNNDINSLASCLGRKGYYSAFFHGAPNGSMGFNSYAKLAGFNDYFGMTEYNNDKDFDGYWAIWDEEFLQYYAKKMTDFPQPFVTSVFTASSHHPFQIPQRYQGKFPAGDLPIHKCIGYTDNALRQFFKTASRQPWYGNTIFVLSADHTNQVGHDEYRTDEKLYSIPIVFYYPGGDLKGMSNVPIGQSDIMPSLLTFLNYDLPYVAFGHDAVVEPDSLKYVVNYNNPLYQMIQGDYMLQFNGEKTVSLYNLKDDPMLRNNLAGQLPQVQIRMEATVKAQAQQYMTRMVEDRLTIATDTATVK